MSELEFVHCSNSSVENMILVVCVFFLPSIGISVNINGEYHLNHGEQEI